MDLLAEGMNDRNAMDSSLERQVQGMAFTRIGVGVAFLLFPGLSLRIWFGRNASNPFSRLMARSVAGRDLALGMGMLFALRHRAPVRGWLEAGAMSDAGDVVSMLMGSRHMSRRRQILSLLPAFGAIWFQRKLVGEVAAATPTETAGLP